MIANGMSSKRLGAVNSAHFTVIQKYFTSWLPDSRSGCFIELVFVMSHPNREVRPIGRAEYFDTTCNISVIAGIVHTIHTTLAQMDNLPCAVQVQKYMQESISEGMAVVKHGDAAHVQVSKDASFLGFLESQTVAR